MFRLLLFFICMPIFASSQLPDTEIWLFRLKHQKDSLFAEKPLNISKRQGYDNQPSFSLDGIHIFYVSVKEDQQADVFSYDIRTKKIIQRVSSPLSEYSPQEFETGNIHSVVVEKDSTQRIHQINLETGFRETLMDPDSVGYYCFLNADSLIYYKLTEPHSLNLYIISSGQSFKIGQKPVRGFKSINRHSFVYGLKDSARVDFFIYEFLIQKSNYYCSYPSLNEDIFWHPELGLMKSEGTQLLLFDTKTKHWKVLFELKGAGMKRITRFTLDERLRYLVVVDNPGD
jgi:hypothetical protein